MLQPFLHNHHLNVIREQVDVLLYNVSHLVDADVKDAVRHNATDRILGLDHSFSDEQRTFLDELRYLDVSEYGTFLEKVGSAVIPFPEITNQQVEKLFHRSKKVTLPFHYSRTLTYLGWHDVRSKRNYLIYPINGELAGIEGSYRILNQRTTCFLCKRYGEVAHVTSHVYEKGEYHTVGHYMCVDTRVCNEHIKEITPLEAFLEKVYNERLNA
ncbi:FusB/FusC family EF-G-binding protein [Alkalihalobacillus sp. R86527]|uniref:FusB/FusC family EF-G-binding protein n=1 Tax=Alkalihalobacillus sp. R86527 TaxID=3093863 RepID=UPI00366AB462